MLAALLVGLALGIGSSIIPGPCGLAVLGAAVHHGRARAIATACGAALGDAIYASLGVAGIGELFARYPILVPGVQAVSGVALMAYGVYSLWTPREVVASAADERRGAWRGLVVGLGLSLANPAVLITWVVLVGGALAREAVPVQACTITGIAAGTAIWFGGLGVVGRRGFQSRGALLHAITRVVCVLLICYGGSLLVRSGAW